MQYTIYKPTKRGTGGAFKFNLHKEGKFSFLQGAKQVAPMGSDRVFGWGKDESVNVKMSAEDLGGILSVIMRFNPSISLYHQTENDNKIIEFVHVPDRKGYSLKISQKRGDSEAIQVFAGITYAEAVVLKGYCEAVIRENLWNNANRQSKDS